MMCEQQEYSAGKHPPAILKEEGSIVTRIDVAPLNERLAAGRRHERHEQDEGERQEQGEGESQAQLVEKDETCADCTAFLDAAPISREASGRGKLLRRLRWRIAATAVYDTCRENGYRQR